jgi:Tfp pilus assembly protein PilV
MEGHSGTRRDCRLRSGRPSLRARLRVEHGGALIEIMMASLLVVMVATAVFKAIDGASATSGGSKSRATAVALAESDQERLRAVPPAELVDRNETTNPVRNGVRYTVQSSSKWVADRDATPDCSSTTSRAGYLRIRTEVTWPDMRQSKPIVASSLVAPPNGTVTSNRGAIGIKILNEAGTGVAGANVSVSGAGLASKQTDATGCAYWDDVPQGTYNYTASKAGYVDYEGDSSVVRPIGVAGGQTRFDTANLDVATSMDVEIVTRRYGGPAVRAVDPAAPTSTALLAGYNYPLRLANPKMVGLGGVRAFPSSDSAVRNLTSLYPLKYGVYVGPCAQSNNPANYGAPFEPAVPYPVPVRPSLPSINVRGSINGNYAAANGVTVYFKLLPVAGETACNVTYQRTLQAVPGVGDGALARPEFPPGRYQVCAHVNQSGWWHAKVDVNNVDPAGTNVALNETIAQSGQCPA